MSEDYLKRIHNKHENDKKRFNENLRKNMEEQYGYEPIPIISHHNQYTGESEVQRLERLEKEVNESPKFKDGIKASDFFDFMKMLKIIK